MSAQVEQPAQLAMSERATARLAAETDAFVKAASACDSTGRSYMRFALVALLITNAVFFVYLVSNEDTRSWLNWIGYPWTIVFALGSLYSWFYLPSTAQVKQSSE